MFIESATFAEWPGISFVNKRYHFFTGTLYTKFISERPETSSTAFDRFSLCPTASSKTSFGRTCLTPWPRRTSRRPSDPSWSEPSDPNFEPSASIFLIAFAFFADEEKKSFLFLDQPFLQVHHFFAPTLIL